jgi:flagellar assembly factor FliW
LKIQTTRFGNIEVEEDQIICMPTGPVGFAEWRRYVLLEHKKGSPFLWLQSVENESLAFVLVDPLLFKPDYEVEISSEDSRSLGMTNGGGGVQALTIVNVSAGDRGEITANLLAPIVINSAKKLGKQVVLYQSQYPTRYPLPTNST